MTITIAIVNDWVITNILEIDDSEYQKYATSCQIAPDITNLTPQPQIGWIFDGANLNPPPGYVSPMQITKLAFRERFTTPELLGILSAASGTTTEALMLQMMMQNQSLATYIDLTRTDTIAGVEFLVSEGLLTSTRANQILTNPPSSIEIYKG